MQLDFYSLGQAAKSEQFNLFAEDLKAASKPKATVIYHKAENFFSTLNPNEVQNYKTYWQSIAPTNDVERFQRWLFAFLSVHSTWSSNVAGYNALKDWTSWFNQWDVLEKKLTESRVGLNKNRHRFLKAFALDFWSNPSEFTKAKNETWQQCRDRLEKRILGLGFAKVSFALEMIYPNEAQVACMDVHLYRAYGLDQSRDSSLGRTIESHFVQMSKLWNCPPAIARAILWDRKQNKTDSRYWSYVLES